MRRRTGLEALEKMTIHEEAHRTGGAREDDDTLGGAHDWRR